MRYLKFTLLALLASAGCNNDKTCNNNSDCPNGYTCAFVVNECVYNPSDMNPPDLLGADLSVPPPDLTAPPPAPDLAPAVKFTSGEAATSLGNPAAPGLALSGPEQVCYSGTYLFVSDTGNNRVLIYNSLAAAAAPVGVIGQASFTTKTAVSPPTAASLDTPRGLWCDGKSLLVADAENSRILYYDISNTATFKLLGTSADGVVGQPDFVHGLENQGGNVAANTLKGPRGVFYDGASARLYIADTENYRVVAYPLPYDTGDAAVETLHGLCSKGSSCGSGKGLESSAAQGVLGQTSLTVRSQPNGGVNNGFAWPVAVSVSDGQIAVVDGDFARVLLFPVPAMFTAGVAPTADAVIGQTTLLGTTGGATQSTFGGGTPTDSGPQGIYTAPSEFFVADTVNNRILYFGDELPSTYLPDAGNTFGQPATAVLGQPNFTTVTPNATPTSLSGPQGVTLATTGTGTFLVVADTNNNRIQVFPAAP